MNAQNQYTTYELFKITEKLEERNEKVMREVCKREGWGYKGDDVREDGMRAITRTIQNGM